MSRSTFVRAALLALASGSVSCGARGSLEVSRVGAGEAGPRDAGVRSDAPPARDAGPPACHPRGPFGPPRAVEGVSTPGLEITPRLSEDEREIYFHGQLDGAVTSDLYTASRAPGAAFGATMRLFASSPWQDYEPAIHPDGLTLTFHSDRLVAFRVFVATRSSLDEPFGEASPLTGLDTPPGAQDYSTAFGHDGDTFWFASDRDGGPDDIDVFEARWNGSAVERVRPVPGINSRAHDFAPAPSADGLALYFTSTRAGGSGDRDVWVAYRDRPGAPFEPPMPVPGINSAFVDDTGWISPDGCRLYFSSNRSGSYDVYVAERLP